MGMMGLSWDVMDHLVISYAICAIVHQLDKRGKLQTKSLRPNLFHLGVIAARPAGWVVLSHPNADAPPTGLLGHCLLVRVPSGDPRVDAGCDAEVPA